MIMDAGLKESIYVKPADVVGSRIGVTRKMFYKAVESGALKGVVMPGCVHHVYRRDEVLRVFGLVDEEAENHE